MLAKLNYMRNLFLFLTLMISFNSLTQSKKWSNMNVILSGNDLRDIKFVDSIKGYVVGKNGQIFKTDNGGLNWSNINSGVSDFLMSINFPSKSIGYIATFGGSGLLKTENGGDNWNNISIGKNSTTGVYFTSVDTGYVCAGGGDIYKTENGGENWQSLVSGVTNSLWKIKFIDSKIGFCVGEGGRILKTTNSGNTWSILNSGVSYRLQSVFFINNDIGFVVGDNGTILKTENGGATWLKQNYGGNDWLFDVYFLDTQLGYICGNANLMTVDGGKNWKSIGYGGVLALTFNNDKGFGAGSDIYKLIDATSNLLNQTENILFELYPNPTPDIIICKVSESQILKGCKFIITDLQGREIYSNILVKNETEISIKSIALSGIYVVQLINQTGDILKEKKIIIE